MNVNENQKELFENVQAQLKSVGTDVYEVDEITDKVIKAINGNSLIGSYVSLLSVVEMLESVASISTVDKAVCACTAEKLRHLSSYEDF